MKLNFSLDQVREALYFYAVHHDMLNNSFSDGDYVHVELTVGGTQTGDSVEYYHKLEVIHAEDQ